MRKPIRYLLAAGILVIAACVAVGLYFFNEKHKNLANTRPDIVITAANLAKEFETDENAATAKYINKVLEISGKVSSVSRGEHNAVTAEISSVICTFPTPSDSLFLQPGKDVVVRGECSGYLMNVLLNNCALVKEEK